MIADILKNLLEDMESIIWMWGICQMKMTQKRTQWVTAAVVLLGTEIALCFLQNEPVSFVVQVLGHMAGIIIFFQETVKNRVIKYWFSLCCVEVVYMPLYILFSIGSVLGKDALLNAVRQEIFSVFTIVFLIIIARKIKRRKQWVIWIRSIPVGYYGLGILCGFCAGGIYAFTKMCYLECNTRIQIVVQVLQMIVILFLYGLGIGFVLVNLWRQQYKRENALKDEYLRMSKEYYQGLAAHTREVRSLRHDMRHHMNILGIYIGEKKWEQAEDYLKEIEEHQIWHHKKSVNVGNELVNAVLSNEMMRVEEDISLICEGMMPQNMQISDFDLCTIFSNLLSNSIEACKRIQKKEKKIYLRLKVYQNRLLILMENPLEWEVSVEKLGNFTSKQDKDIHGYGVYNVMKTVEKYGGDLEFQAEKEMFQVKIMLVYM